MAIGAAFIWLLANPFIAALMGVGLVVFAIKRRWFGRLILVAVASTGTYFLIEAGGVVMTGTTQAAIITFLFAVMVAPLLIHKWLQDDEAQETNQEVQSAFAGLMDIQRQAKRDAGL